MSALLPYFDAMQDDFLCRVFVAGSDLICVRLGRGFTVEPPSFLGSTEDYLDSFIDFAIGAMYDGNDAGCGPSSKIPDRAGNFERRVQEDLNHLVTLDAAGILDHVREKRRGYTIDCKKLAKAKIDLVGKWRRIIFGTPVPALIVKLLSKRTSIFVFRKRMDVVVGMYELEQLLGDKLEVASGLDDYVGAVKKYRKMREA
jgi:hypothetical protein